MSFHAVRHPGDNPSVLVIFLELRQQSIDTAVFIARHLDHSVPGHGAACDGGQDADTDPGLRPRAPPRPSVAALRSAGSHRRRLLPHETSPSPRRWHPQNQLISPEERDFQLATNGDLNLAVDTGCCTFLLHLYARDLLLRRTLRGLLQPADTQVTSHLDAL